MRCRTAAWLSVGDGLVEPRRSRKRIACHRGIFFSPGADAAWIGFRLDFGRSAGPGPGLRQP